MMKTIIMRIYESKRDTKARPSPSPIISTYPSTHYRASQERAGRAHSIHPSIAHLDINYIIIVAIVKRRSERSKKQEAHEDKLAEFVE